MELVNAGRLLAHIDRSWDKRGSLRKKIENLELATFKDFVEGAVEDQPFLEEHVQATLQQLPEVAEH